MRYRFDGSTLTVEIDGVAVASAPAKDQSEANALIDRVKADGYESIVAKPKKVK